MRLDEALRLYLENFRLPGEAPVISWIMEHFSEHWHVSCDELPSPLILAFELWLVTKSAHWHMSSGYLPSPLTRWHVSCG